MSHFDNAQFKSIVDGDKMHAFYVVFSPDVQAARTVQWGSDTGRRAYIDVDADDFPVALELRGWNPLAVRRDAVPQSLLEKARFVNDNKNRMKRFAEIAEEAGEFVGYDLLARRPG